MKILASEAEELDMSHIDKLPPEIRAWMQKIVKSVQGAQKEVVAEFLEEGIQFRYKHEMPLTMELFEGEIQIVRYMKMQNGKYKNQSANFKIGAPFEHVADRIVEILQMH
jgi:hypothetical protein